LFIKNYNNKLGKIKGYFISNLVDIKAVNDYNIIMTKFKSTNLNWWYIFKILYKTNLLLNLKEDYNEKI